MRIELLGASGVGKTTTIRAAEGLRGDPVPWFGPAEADALIEKSPTPQMLRDAIDDAELREFVERCLTSVSASAMLPSQKINAPTFLRKSCFQSAALRAVELDRPLVHDELMLHRAFSLLLYSRQLEVDARWYFELVPVPDSVVVFRADPSAIVERVRRRPHLPNVYLGLDDTGLRDAVARSLELSAIAEEILGERGVPVWTIDTTRDIAHGAQELHDFIIRSSPRTPMTDETPRDDSRDIRDRLLTASGSFRKKAGRHELRTKDVMYCAFTTPRFSVSREESQRDAATRVAHFGLTRQDVEGTSVLDLGSNAGAMLFELSNFNPSRGLGIEYDKDKVDLANEITEFADIPNLRFEQGDIDELVASELGVFDTVLALAIESHVQHPDRLYTLLGQVTGRTLCFEGNSGCDMDEARAKLRAAGFTEFVDLGFCNDDIDPRNNRRPQLLARKPSKKPGLLARLRGKLG
jgi:SAM-dependent methyltransferase